MTAFATGYSQAMRWLYLACIVLCVLSVVCMTGLIFTGVVMRYAFETGARFSEPMSIFSAVQLTMYGAAACYRAKAHLQIHYFVNLMLEPLRFVPRRLVELLMAGIVVFMIYFGLSLAEMTWFQAYPEFDYVRVGFVYSAIPGSGLVMLLFVIETAILGPPEDDEDEEPRRAVDHADHEQRTLDRWAARSIPQSRSAHCLACSSSACRSPMPSARRRWRRRPSLASRRRRCCSRSPTGSTISPSWRFPSSSSPAP